MENGDYCTITINKMMLLPFGHSERVWLEADVGRPVGQVVLVDVDAERNVLVLEVGLHLLSCLL